MRGFGRGILVALIVAAALYTIFIWHPWNTASSSDLLSCGNGVYVQPGSSCPNGNAPQQGTTPQAPQTGNTPVQNTGVVLVATASQPCPSTDFSLEKGVATCNYSGGKLLICEGDLSDSLGVTHDSDPNTGQVDEIDQAATIDGRDNGGTCHYSPPWTLQQSISSVKHGCGGTCATVLVYKDGQQIQTS